MHRGSIIRPFTKKELAGLYNISSHCLTTMLKPFEEYIGRRCGRYYTVKQVKVIFDCLGYPDDFLSDALKK